MSETAADVEDNRATAKVVERDVEVKTPDGTADAALFYPEGEGAWPAVLIWPDIRGLRPTFRAMGRRLAAQGYVVLVPNLFYRIKRAPVPEGPLDFKTPEGMAEVKALAGSLTPERTERDAVAYLAFLDAQPQTRREAKAGVHGYCLGGPLAFRTSAALPRRVGALGSFHGGGLVTDTPESPHLVIPRMRVQAYIAVAEDDDSKAPGGRGVLERAFAEAQLQAEVELYQGAKHSWCVPDSPAYNEPAAERAWRELNALYRSALHSQAPLDAV